MIRNYFRMKRNEWKIKAMIYSTIATLIDNQKEGLKLLQKMYIALKGCSCGRIAERIRGKTRRNYSR